MASRRQFLKSVASASVIGPATLCASGTYGANGDTNSTPMVNYTEGVIPRTSGELRRAESLVHEAQRSVPLAGTSEVLVCGGGPAGIAAALSAARAGADVQLIELAGCLGGVWTAGMLTKILDSSNKDGIMKEILAAFASRGSAVAHDSAGTVYDPELAKLVIEEMCVEAGIKIRLHTMIVGAIVDKDNRLVAIITESKSGRQAWCAERFIDCTGDGDLAALAGCEFDVGIGADCTCQPMSLMGLITGIETEGVTQYIRETGSAAKARLYNLMKSAGIDPSYRAPTLRHLHSNIFSIMTNHEYGVSAFDAGAISQATIQARKEVHDIVHGLKKLGGPWSDIAVVATAEQIGVREGRRIKGRYMITANDLIGGSKHSEAVCTARFSIDVHSLELAGNPEQIKEYQARGVKPYSIPYPALVAADVDGLLMAGRCISGDFIAHSSYRVTGNAVPMGEAAGLAAAESIRRNVLPHELSWNEVRPIG